MSTLVRVAVFKDRTHLRPTKTTQLTIDDFVAWLRRCSQNEIAKKQSNCLVTTAKFAGPRCLANVESIIGLWLDNDDGRPRHEELLALFPTLRIVAFNTHSAREEAPKYRVLIPTAREMTAEEYARLWRGVIGKIHAAYPGHGFDPATRHAAAIFYAPCQPGSGQASDAFFVDRAGELMNVAEYMAEPEKTDEVLAAPLTASIAQIQDALACIHSDDRHIWFSVLCALHHELGQPGKELARRWSMTSPKYEPQEFERTWRSIVRGKPQKPITVATIFHLAKATQTLPPNVQYKDMSSYNA